MGNDKEVKSLLTYDEDLDVHLPFSRFNVDQQGADDGIMALALIVRAEDIENVKSVLKKGMFHYRKLWGGGIWKFFNL